MPLYDYGCPVCGESREVSHPMSEIGKVDVKCDCGQKMVKQLSAPTLIGFDDVGRSIKPTAKATKEPAPACKGGACGCA